ncbi:MAG: glycogen-binding domain-containing protein [Deltaproteobacteria bacterium]|nr:glycogen-binding domain-containing protein [Deltaproteobacteria bacterium]
MPNRPFEKKSHQKPDDFNGSSRVETRDLQLLAGLIADIPEIEPPEEIMAEVMGRIRPKNLSQWQRFMRWLKAPKSLTFTPMQIAPACALITVLILAFLFSPIQIFKRDSGTETAIKLAETGTPVVFSLDMPEASSVAVIGSFNQWSPNGYEMKRENERGSWTLVTSLKKGRYIYAFLVDGRLVVPDSQAVLHQDDGFGNKNSILIINNGGNYEKSI